MSWLKKNMTLIKKPSADDTFEEQIVMNILNNVPYSYIKIEKLYVELTVQIAETIDDELRQENEDYLQTAAKFNKINTVATARKKQP